MLPWEHLAVAYIGCSLWCRVWYGRPPDGPTALMVVLASQLPDLIDKPLAWGTELLDSGRSLGHSLFFGVPATLAVRFFTGPRLTAAFAIGFFSHSLTDVFHPVLRGGSPEPALLVWPLISGGESDTIGFFARTNEIFAEFFEVVTQPEGQLYLLFNVVLLGTAFVLWWRDGFPGLGLRYLQRRRSKESQDI
ncbi:metal-dependent hydrolase (plasmid) [Haloferacaceae archaeon DSL9]